MTNNAPTPEEQNPTLTDCLDQYLKRGFRIERQSTRSAELYKPARFPAWLFREERRFLDVGEQGRVYIQKR